MKVLVADKFEKSGIEGLKAAGCDVIYQPDLKDDSLTAAIRDTAADVLVVRGDPTREITALWDVLDVYQAGRKVARGAA